MGNGLAYLFQFNSYIQKSHTNPFILIHRTHTAHPGSTSKHIRSAVNCAVCGFYMQALSHEVKFLSSIDVAKWDPWAKEIIIKKEIHFHIFTRASHASPLVAEQSLAYSIR